MSSRTANIHYQNALDLTETQRKALIKLENPSMQFMPFRNVNDADCLFDLLWLVQVKFVDMQVVETLPRQKLLFKLSLAGMYARSVIMQLNQNGR